MVDFFQVITEKRRAINNTVAPFPDRSRMLQINISGVGVFFDEVAA